MLHDSHRLKTCIRSRVLFALVGLSLISGWSMPLGAQESGKAPRNNATNPFATPQEEIGSLTDVVDDRAIKKLISTRAEALLPDPEVSLTANFGEQLRRTETSLRLPKVKSAALASHEVYPAVSPSVLVLSKVYKCGRCTRWHDRSAGAFALTANGAIVTNYHVVNGLKEDERALVATSASGKVYVVKEILAADELNDIAILQLEMPAGEKLQPAKIAAKAIPGEDVYVISHPAGRFYTLTKGVVSRNAIVYANNVSRQRLYVTAEFAKGSSGSPIFNSRGEVVGIVASTQSIYYTQTAEEQKNLQMVFRNCVPASAVHSLVK
ncbi:MAG: serine protease [Pirellulaceae bacterium]|jgi:S1-C subfamily serine protease|nr:serine protease [Pirellulaceae bacterium]